MQRLLAADKTHFYDKIVLLQKSPYGSVPASQVLDGLSGAQWLERSSVLRLEHEMTHYATNRMLGSFRLNIHDELLADFMGISAALGSFSSALFFAAMGVEDDICPEGCRYRHYTQELDEEALAQVLALSRLAADNLERLSTQLPREYPPACILLALAAFDIPAMAKPACIEQILATAEKYFNTLYK